MTDPIVQGIVDKMYGTDDKHRPAMTCNHTWMAPRREVPHSMPVNHVCDLALDHTGPCQCSCDVVEEVDRIMTNSEALVVGIVAGLLTQFGADMEWKVAIPVDDDNNYVQPITVTTKATTLHVTIREAK